VKILDWDLGLSSRDTEDLKEILELVKDLKYRGVTGASVAMSFCRRLIQPIKDLAHPAYEYWGQSDPMHEVNRKVSKKEMEARVSRIYSGKVKTKKCPNAHSLKRPTGPVSSWDLFSGHLLCLPLLCRLTLLVIGCLQEREHQFWCPASLREGELHRRKLRSDKYQPQAARLLEFYESDSSVQANKDTDVEVSNDAGAGPDAGGAAKSRRKTGSVAVKQSATTAAAAVSAVKAAEKKKKKRKASPPSTIETSAIATPQSREVESEEEEEEDETTEEPPVVENKPVRRSESPAAKRQWELVQKTMEDALRQGLEAQRTAAAA
jgi:hypothetical protein